MIIKRFKKKDEKEIKKAHWYPEGKKQWICECDCAHFAFYKEGGGDIYAECVSCRTKYGINYMEILYL